MFFFIFFKGLLARCHSFYFIIEQTYNILYLLLVEHHSCCPHCFPLGRGPPLGCQAEIRTRVCHTASWCATIWATRHPECLFLILRSLQGLPSCSLLYSFFCQARELPQTPSFWNPFLSMNFRKVFTIYIQQSAGVNNVGRKTWAVKVLLSNLKARSFRGIILWLSGNVIQCSRNSVLSLQNRILPDRVPGLRNRIPLPWNTITHPQNRLATIPALPIE